MRVARIGIFVALVAAITACAKHDQSPATEVAGHPGYHIQQTVTLPATDVPEARLELLEDSRITPTLRASFQRGLPDDACAQPKTDTVHAFCDTIRRQLLLPALLRVADASGRDLDTATLERPIAGLMLVIDDAPASRRVYGVSVDLTADAGTYSGPYVRLLDQRSRRFDWLRARDSSSGAVDEVHLATTPKSAWQVVPGADGANSDILAVACRPSHRRIERGFWESDGTFPPRSRFP